MKNKHPAPFPVALPLRCIESTKAQVILDPFSGSGTTAIAAKQLNRNFIGIDISPEYCQLAQSRIEETISMPAITEAEGNLFETRNK